MPRGLVPFAGTAEGPTGRMRMALLEEPRQWVPHLTELVPHPKGTFLSSGLMPKWHRLLSGVKAFTVIA